MQPSSSRARHVIFDIAKILLAYLVVNLHVESFLTGEPFSFIYYLGWYAVPSFVVIYFYFISRDYFTTQLSSSTFLKRLRRILTPFIFWSVVGFMFHPDLITIKYLLRQLLTGTAVDPPLYYLLAIAVVLSLFNLLRYVITHQRVKVCMAVIIVMLALEESGAMTWVLSYVPIQINFFTSRLLEIIKYASLGILLGYYKQSLLMLRQYRRIAVVCCGLALASYNFWQYSTSATNLNYAGLAQFALVAVGFVCLMLYENVELRLGVATGVASVGKYALGVYCIHTFFLELAQFLSLSYSPIVSTNIIFLASLTVAIMIPKLTKGKLAHVVS